MRPSTKGVKNRTHRVCLRVVVLRACQSVYVTGVVNNGHASAAAQSSPTADISMPDIPPSRLIYSYPAAKHASTSHYTKQNFIPPVDLLTPLPDSPPDTAPSPLTHHTSNTCKTTLKK
ncbi:hypothetical protein E2C01_051524 [Portunus trituberculatus]|uniref:Uncharacterized protein n=1 Tax=Portunus trituberculatus TaxID=210409 RepID=A0A5B7GBU8_PORTR|nr:hypothetical protein [Portunus trituberculatus]